MSKKLTWDETGDRLYETGTKMGVVYPYSEEFTPEDGLTDGTHGLAETKSKYGPGVAWNGLTGVTESPGGAVPTDLWADDIKYLSIRAAETFGGNIECYTYPDAVAVLNGEEQLLPGLTIGQQSRKAAGFCYRTIVGNDTQLNDYSYKLHLAYGMTLSPSERAYSTVNDSPEAITFSFDFETTPVNFTISDKSYSTAILTIDVSKLSKEKASNIKLLEACLYGTETTDPFLPLPDEVYEILNKTVSP